MMMLSSLNVWFWYSDNRIFFMLFDTNITSRNRITCNHIIFYGILTRRIIFRIFSLLCFESSITNYRFIKLRCFLSKFNFFFHHHHLSILFVFQEKYSVVVRRNCYINRCEIYDIAALLLIVLYVTQITYLKNVC